MGASSMGVVRLAVVDDDPMVRAALAGGRISHGTDPGGGYAVRAWIPWDT